MSSATPITPSNVQKTLSPSPVKEYEKSYDSRESADDQNPQKANPTVKKVTKKIKNEQSVPQNTEEPLSEEGNEIQKQEAVNPEVKDQEKKKKKKAPKKASENIEDVTQSNPAAEEQKPKVVKKKAPEPEPQAPVAEVKKVEAPVENFQPKGKASKKSEKIQETAAPEPTVQKVVKNPVKIEKTQETAVSVAKTEPENKKSQAKNLQVAEPAGNNSSLVNALVSPTQLKGKANAANKTFETETRYSKTMNTQPREEERGTAISKVSVQPGNSTLKKSPTQGEISEASSPKSRLGPIKSKIETGLKNIREGSRKGDTSEISNTVLTQKAKSPKPEATRAKSPNAAIGGRQKTAERVNTTMHKSYILESVNTHTDLKNKRKEKPRMRSFDAGKTDKIKAEDTFETRSRMWQIRKNEKLLEEEKKKRRKEVENCTFTPALIKKSTTSDLSTSTIYDRCIDWTEKVKSSIATKGEEILEAVKKPEPKKPRVKSFNGPPEIKSSKVFIEGFTGPQFGVSKTSTVPSFSQDPLVFKGNLDEKVNEICTLYENLSNHLKLKSVKNNSNNNLSKSVVKEKAKPREDSKPVSRVSISSQKERPAKVEAVVNIKGDDQRMSSLRGILNLNAKEKKSQSVVMRDRVEQEQIEEETTDRVPVKSTQRVEIRNNKYVIIDDENDISAIGRKENDSNYELSLNFDASTVQHVA